MSGKLLLHITYSLTWLKCAVWVKIKCSPFPVDNASRFLLPNCQFLTNSNFENSFETLIWLAKNHELLIFEYWFALSLVFWPTAGKKVFFLWFFRKNGHFWGVRSERFFFFFFKLCCSRSYHYVSITKNQLLPYK